MYSFITLKQLREMRNLTQSYMASELGVTQSAYSKIENFDCQTSIKNYTKISLLLDADLDQIISNKIQALIYIKSSSQKENIIGMNLTRITEMVNVIKEHEVRLDKLIQSYSAK